MIAVSLHEHLFSDAKRVDLMIVEKSLYATIPLSIPDALELRDQLTELLDSIQREELASLPKDIEAMELVS